MHHSSSSNCCCFVLLYQPNIDSEGRICLDTLKMQPQGSWAPSVNINTLLLSIRLLLAYPNPEDGLVADIVRYD